MLLNLSEAIAARWRALGLVVGVSRFHCVVPVEHVPELQVPVVHGGPVPHWQPSAPQVSAKVGLHEVHTPPLRPQEEMDAGTQTSRSQQLAPAHEAESQTQLPARQRWPLPHGPERPHEQLPPTHRSAVVKLQVVQLEPPAPHELALVEVTHV